MSPPSPRLDIMTITTPPPRYRLEIPEVASKKIEQDHGAGHRLLMALLPDGALDGASPRQAAGLLWAKTKPTELLVSSRFELSPTKDITIHPADSNPPEGGRSYLLHTTLETTYTPAAWVPEEIWNMPNRPPIHGKRVPVPQNSIEQWIIDKLERSGFEATNLESVSPRRMRVRKHTIPVAEITAEVTVTDEKSALSAYNDGFGRAKNFGCGLLQLRTLA